MSEEIDPVDVVGSKLVFWARRRLIRKLLAYPLGLPVIPLPFNDIGIRAMAVAYSLSDIKKRLKAMPIGESRSVLSVIL